MQMDFFGVGLIVAAQQLEPLENLVRFPLQCFGEEVRAPLCGQKVKSQYIFF